jgi:hypothetical protein
MVIIGGGKAGGTAAAILREEGGGGFCVVCRCWRRRAGGSCRARRFSPGWPVATAEHTSASTCGTRSGTTSGLILFDAEPTHLPTASGVVGREARILLTSSEHPDLPRRSHCPARTVKAAAEISGDTRRTCQLRSSRLLPDKEDGHVPRTRRSRLPFEPTSKRRRKFPPANPASSAATASWALTLNSSRSSAATTHVHAGQDGAFRHCCRRTGRFDGTPAAYYVRDRNR